jgi:hypothetical protein
MVFLAVPAMGAGRFTMSGYRTAHEPGRSFDVLRRYATKLRWKPGGCRGCAIGIRVDHPLFSWNEQGAQILILR